MIVVLDASVVVKWLLKDPGQDAGTDKATELMKRVAGGALEALEPPHRLAEVGPCLLAKVRPLRPTM